MEKAEKIVVEELEEQAEPKQKEMAELGVQSFEPSAIGGMFFTEKGLTIFPKSYMEKFMMEKNEGLIGKQSEYDYSQVAGALERVVTLEKENHDLKDKLTKLEAMAVKKDEDEKPDEKPPEEKDPDVPPLTPEEEEKKKLADKEKEKEKAEATAKSVETAETSTKESADHSGVDDDIKRAMGSLKKAREAGQL